MGLYQKFMRFLTQGKPSPWYQRKLDAARPRTAILFGTVKFHRWYLLPLTFLIEMVLGSTSAWPTYCETFGNEFGENTDLTSVINVLTLFLGISNFFADPAIVRFGPRAVFTVSTTLFLISNLILALAIYLKSLPLVYIGIGVIGGLADGATFPCPLLVLQRYFPDKRGLAAAFATGGYGAGTILGSFGHAALLKSFGQGKMHWGFVILAVAYGVLNICVSPLYDFPPEESEKSKVMAEINQSEVESIDAKVPAATVVQETENGATGQKKKTSKAKLKELKIAEGVGFQFPTVEHILKHHIFYVFSLAFALNSIGYFALVTRVLEFFTSFKFDNADYKTWTSVTVITGITGVFNVAGRMISGAVFDILGQGSNISPVLYIFSGGIQICGFALYLLVIEKGFFTGLPIGAWIISFAYGSAFGPAPGMMCQLFGAKHIGSVFAIFFTAWSIVGLASGPLLKLLDDPKDSSLKSKRALTYATLPFMLFGTLFAAYLLYYVRSRNQKILGPQKSAT